MLRLDTENVTPHAAPEGRAQHRAIRDLVVAAAVVVCGGALFVSTDAVERLWPALRRWESAEVDDLLLTLVLTVVVASWFSFRRFRESRAQVAELERNAEERASYMKRLEDLSSQLLEIEERERNRISEVLHDEIGQTLYACQLRLDLLAARSPGDAEQALVAQAKELTSAAMTRARDLSVQLSPPALQDLGLAEALESLLTRLQARYGLTMQFTPSSAWDEIRRTFYGPVFQSVAELAVNAAKHGDASRVVLSAELDPGGKVHVMVVDDGGGFDQPAAVGRGFGLFSVERRMACIDGSLEIRSSSGGGTTAILSMPAGH